MHKSIIGAALALGMCLGTPSAAETFKGETAGAGGPIHTVFVAFSNAARDGGVDIEVNAGKTLTKSMLSAGKGDIGFYSGVPSLYSLMQGQKAMYEKIGDAPEYAANLRSIFGFRAGVYHTIVKGGTGIETWEDLKGKRVFTGPPAGSANRTAQAIIKISSGLVAGTDYTAVILPWGEGTTAFRDGNVDVMFRPADVGSALIQQFGLNAEFRILSIPDEAMSNPDLIELSGNPGRGIHEFPGDVYKGQLTEGTVRALSFSQFVGTTNAVSEDVVYAATKAFWENLDEVHATANFLKDITLETAFVAVNLPLHKGAYRYYKEAGFDVPESIIPAQ